MVPFLSSVPARRSASELSDAGDGPRVGNAPVRVRFRFGCPAPLDGIELHALGRAVGAKVQDIDVENLGVQHPVRLLDERRVRFVAVVRRGNDQRERRRELRGKIAGEPFRRRERARRDERGKLDLPRLELEAQRQLRKFARRERMRSDAASPRTYLKSDYAAAGRLRLARPRKASRRSEEKRSRRVPAGRRLGA